MDDFELLAAWRGGDTKAGDRLFMRHYDAVRRFFVNKVSDELDDLVQRTFLVCVERPHGFEGRSSFRAFLLGVAYRVLLSFIRHKQRRQGLLDPATESIAATGTGAFTRFVRAREQEALLAALRRIPLEYQTVLELYYWERMSASDCGRALELPEGTIRSRLRRARELLLAALQEVAAEPGPHEADDLERWRGEIRGRLEVAGDLAFACARDEQGS